MVDRNIVWKNFFGDAPAGKDAYGRTVYKEDFVIDHIWPIVNGGKNNQENLMAVHKTSNEEKSENMSGKINGKSFQVQGTKESGIISLANGDSFSYKGKT